MENEDSLVLSSCKNLRNLFANNKTSVLSLILLHRLLTAEALAEAQSVYA